MSQRHTAARRHRALPALFQSPSSASRPSPPRFLTTIHPSCSRAIIITTPRTMHINVWHCMTPPAYSLQTMWWPTHPATPTFHQGNALRRIPWTAREVRGSVAEVAAGQDHQIKTTQRTLPVHSVLAYFTCRQPACSRPRYST